MSQTQAMREELTALYAQMSTEELLERYQPEMLTDIAADVMKQELLRRGITPPPITSPLTETTITDNNEGQLINDWVDIAVGLSATEAHILRSRLEIEGVLTTVRDSHAAQLMSSSVVASQARVQVPAEQAEQAQEIMQALERGDFAIDETDASQEPEPLTTNQYTPTPLKIIRNDSADTPHNPYAAPREFRDQGYYEETDEYGTVREVLSPQTRKQQLYAAFAQDKYYPAHWEAGINWISFNLSAFIFGSIWCFFRKLYVVGLIVLATHALINYLIVVFYSSLHTALPLPLFTILIQVALVRLPLAIVANGLYGSHAEKRIATLSARHPNDTDLLKALKNAGGISIGAMLFGLVLQFVMSQF